MSTQISDNFKLRTEMYLDDRNSFKTILDMKNFNIEEIPDGFITYCEEDLKHYKITKLGAYDDYTGYWSQLSSGSSGGGGGDVDESLIIAQALSQSKAYTNLEISKIVDGAPANIDTIGKLAIASISNKDRIDAINTELGSKANVSDIYEQDGVTPKYITPQNVANYAPKIMWTDPTTDKVGNVDAGYVPPTDGVSLTDFLYKLTHRSIGATIAISLNPSTLIQEQGVSIINPSITATVTKGTSIPTYVKFYRSGSLINTTQYSSATQTYTYQDNYSVSSNTSYKAEVLYNLDGTSTTANATISYSFVYPLYSGSISTAAPTSTDIKSLTKTITNSKAATKSYTQSSKWMCFAYPSSYGNLTSIKDVATGYQLIDGWNKINLIIDSQTYYVYISSQCTVSNYNVQFS